MPDIGLGCAAHSYIHPHRFWNVSDVNRYCLLLKDNELPMEQQEFIDDDKFAREMIFLGFRQKRGLNEDDFLRNTGKRFDQRVGEALLQRFIAEKYLLYSKPWWIPTEKGMRNADFLARELF